MVKRRSTKKIAAMCAVLLAVFACLAALFLFRSYAELNEESDLHMKEIAIRGADKASTVIDQNFKLLTVLADNVVLDAGLSGEDKRVKLENAAKTNNLLRLGYADADGNVTATDGSRYNVKDLSYYVDAMKGNNSISKIAQDRGVSGGLTWTIAVPVKENGQTNGVLFGVYPADQLSSLINVDFFNGKGYCYMIDNDGVVMMSPEQNELDANFYDILKQSTVNQQDVNNAEHFQSMLRQNQSGTTVLKLQGKEYFCSFASMKSINNDVLNILCITPSDIVFGGSQNVLTTSLFACLGLLVLFIAIILVFIFQTRKHTEKLVELAYYDQLTGLPNFTKFCEDYDELRAQDQEADMAVVCMDIDRFKRMNETFGHPFGDKVLAEVGGLLRGVIGENVLYGRMMSDNFVIAMRSEKNNPNLMALLTKINESISKINVQGLDIKLQASFGIYVTGKERVDVRTCVDDAKMTAKLCKTRPDSTFAFFDRDLQEKMLQEQQTQTELETAFHNNELSVNYQPLMSFKDTRIITGAEALIRWQHPKKGFIGPDYFIPIAEKSNLIYKVGRFVFEQVCRDMADWKKYDEQMPVSVNISRVELYQSDLVDFMKDTIKRYGISPNQIEIELTETAAIDDMELLKTMVQRFKSIGFRVAMDDFGTGYSSLACLSAIPFDVLKLDRSLISGMDKNERGCDTVSSVISLGKSFGFTIVAEGVETKEEADLLANMGCDVAQGFYYAHPMKKETLEMFAFPSLPN